MYRSLGIFARSPQPGEVKTRLIPELGAEGACELYRAFLRDTFRRVGQLRSARVTVFYDGTPSSISDLFTNTYPLAEQSAGGLGDRLAAAFEHLLRGPGHTPRAAVIIGSDSPDLPMTYIKRAYTKLKHNDVVLGPASDGGYYLIGLKQHHPSLFEEIAWGGDKVFEQTVERTRQAGLTLSLLPLWYDVDTPDGLATLRRMTAARRVAGGVRLAATEPVIERLCAPSARDTR